MTLSAKTETGDEITVIAFDGNQVTVHSAWPYAPGQPMTLSIAVDPVCVTAARTTGAKRLGSGPFEIRLRVVSQTREDRQRLLDAMSVSRRD